MLLLFPLSVCVFSLQSLCVCVLTGHYSEPDSSIRENSPGCWILGVADVVVSGVTLEKIRKVQVPVQADHHSVVLLDVHHLWNTQHRARKVKVPCRQEGKTNCEGCCSWEQEGSLVHSNIDFHMWVKQNGQLKRHYFIRLAVRERREGKKWGISRAQKHQLTVLHSLVWVEMVCNAA